MVLGNSTSEVQAVVRDGLMVTRDGAVLPPRCVVCNVACDDFRWLRVKPRANLLLLIVTGINLHMAAFADRDSVVIGAAFCAVHREVKRMVRRRVFIGIVVTLVAAVLAGIYWAWFVSFLVIPAGFIAVVVYSVVLNRRGGTELILKRRAGEAVFIDGAGAAFLESLAASDPASTQQEAW